MKCYGMELDRIRQIISLWIEAEWICNMSKRYENLWEEMNYLGA